MTETPSPRPGPRPGAVERAYQLAREGKTPSEIKRELTAEHYVDAQAQLWGPTLIGDLRRLAKLSNAATSGG